MKIKVNWINDFGFTAEVRHFKNVLIDEPLSFKGNDRGPSPVEYILIGIGSCLGASFIHCCKINNFEIKKLNIVVDGKMTHRKPYNHLELAYVNVELNIIHFEEKTNEKFEKCLEIFREYCVVSNSLIRGLPINVNIKQDFR